MQEDQAPARVVYVVTHGCYSDYHIFAVYSTREAAEACHARYPGEYTQITVYALDRPFPHPEMPAWRVSMERDGTVRWVARSTPDRIENALPAGSFGTYLWKAHTIIECYAHDEQHAIKIANEHRIKLQLQGEGLA